MSRLVLIDGHAILHRAYHAYPPLTTSKGELVNAVYGFTSIFFSVLDLLKPKYAVVAFDLPKPTFRHKKYKAYKAHRPKVDQELVDQIPRAHQVVQTLNIPIFEVEGFEADDVIGTLAKKLVSLRSVRRHVGPPRETLELIIVTGDKDAFQLISNTVKVLIPSRGKKPAQLIDRKAFLERYGFEPRYLVDFKALAGDPSDGIPGVAGIGFKTAQKLIVQFGSLKEIYSQLDRMETIVAARLKAQKKQALLSYKLAEIVTQVPLKLDLSQCLLSDYDQQKVIHLFEELEFKSLIKRLPGQGKEERAVAKKIDENKQMGLF